MESVIINRWDQSCIFKYKYNYHIKLGKAHTNENPDDSKWIKRWSNFMKSLEDNKNNEAVLKELCSKFMTAQRTKKYRRGK